MSSPGDGGLSHRGQPSARGGDDGARSAAQRAYDAVKDSILRGEYPGGMMLTEGDVAAKVRVSRTPVREAFLRLRAEGLLQLYPKRGALVVPVSHAEIADVLEARQLVERHAADAAISSGQHGEVAAAMRAVLHRQCDPALSSTEFTDLDRLFHGALVEATRNRLLIEFYAALRDRQLRMGTSALLRDPQRRALILDEHAALCRTLESGDRDAVAAAVSGHLAGTRAALR
jgi:DNA-binding GntR family transcriptional regulator